MAKLYRIRNWSHFETNRTRILQTLNWVPIPNDLASDGYTDLMEHENGIGYFGVFIVCVELSSKCNPRGTLLRRDGTPHDLQSLSRITRIPLQWLKDAFVQLLRVGWLEEVESATQVAFEWHSGAGGTSPNGKKGRNGKKGMKEGSGGNHQRLMELWHQLHHRDYHAKPTVTGASAKVIKFLAGLPDGAKVLKTYFADKDDYLVKTAHSLQLLPARVDRYRASLAPTHPDISEKDAADVIAAIKQKGSHHGSHDKRTSADTGSATPAD